jgi:formate hydrogenlyase subunit 4
MNQLNMYQKKMNQLNTQKTLETCTSSICFMIVDLISLEWLSIVIERIEPRLYFCQIYNINWANY